MKSSNARWVIGVASLLSFAAGSLVTGRLMRPEQVRANGNRVFELMIYHTQPGKAPALESIFRDCSKLMTKHGIDVIGFWLPNQNPVWEDTFIYLTAQPSVEEAKKNWQALHSDPEFPQYREAAVPLIQKDGERFNVDEVYMRPSDFSAMK
jgi:NIPSNAP